MSSTSAVKKTSKKIMLDAEQCDSLKTAIASFKAEARYPVAIVALAGRTSIEINAAMKLLKSKILKLSFTAIDFDDQNSPVVFVEDQIQLVASPISQEFIANRIRDKRKQLDLPIASDVNTFLKDASLTPKLRTVLKSHIQQRIQEDSLPNCYQDLIQLPPNEEKLARHFIDVLSSLIGSDSARPVRLSEIISAARYKPNAKQTKAILKRPEFADHAVECVVPSSQTTDPAFLLTKSLDQNAASLATQLIRQAKLDSMKTVKKSIPKPSQAFNGLVLASLLLKSKSEQIQFATLLDSLARENALSSELSSIIYNNTRLFFLSADIRSGNDFVEVPNSSQSNGPRTVTQTTFEVAFHNAFQKIDLQNGSTNFVTVLELRNALPGFSRQEFDTELRKLRISNQYAMDTAQGSYVRLTDAERDAGIREGSSLLVYVSRK